ASTSPVSFAARSKSGTTSTRRFELAGTAGPCRDFGRATGCVALVGGLARYVVTAAATDEPREDLALWLPSVGALFRIEATPVERQRWSWWAELSGSAPLGGVDVTVKDVELPGAVPSFAVMLGAGVVLRVL